jgi:hypothetical protein
MVLGLRRPIGRRTGMNKYNLVINEEQRVVLLSALKNMYPAGGDSEGSLLLGMLTSLPTSVEQDGPGILYDFTL